MRGLKVICILLIVLLIAPGLSAQETNLKLDYKTAEKFSALPLDCINIEYPNKLGQVLTDSSHLLGPKELHPIFYGCFDWHSAVHGHWLLAKVMNEFPDSDLSTEIVNLFDRQFTTRNVQIELLYFQPKLNQSYERTYGWAWLLKLYAELKSSPLDIEHNWTAHLQSLTDFIAEKYKEFLPKMVYPIRVGEHTNTAFGLSLAIDYARIVEDVEFENLIIERSKDFYLEDEACPLGWEPSGFDFISPCLQEAELMSKVLDEKGYKKWLKSFLPQLFEDDFSLEPGRVKDRTDGKLVHLDGLNFSRAWCFYSIAKSNPKISAKCIELGDTHLKASMAHVSESDYMGSHWLASFLIYALEKRGELLME